MSHNRRKNISQFKRLPICTYDEGVRKGRVNILTTVESCYFEGVRLNYWDSRITMFKVLKSIGLKYSYCSYHRFKGGKYLYLPNQFLSVLFSVVGCNFTVVQPLVDDEVRRVISRHPDLWA